MRKIYIAILHTKGLEQKNVLYDDGKELWKGIYELMDGQKAIVSEAGAEEGMYLFLGLEDEDKNKELFWQIEQDDFIGCGYSREEFDEVWANEEYDPGGCMYLSPENVEIIEPLNGELRLEDQDEKL